MAHLVMAYIVMAHLVLAHLVMAHLVMAHIVMAYLKLESPNEKDEGRKVEWLCTVMAYILASGLYCL